MGAFGRPSVFHEARNLESADNGGRKLASIMTLQEFTQSTSRDTPPSGLTPVLEALWHVRKGNWDRAHAIVQDYEEDREYALVHAHLHRIEGDLANAGYWYRRAGKKPADAVLEEEWQSLVAQFFQENA